MKVVVGVGGSGSTTWPRALLDNQSTYKPTYIATSESSLISYVQSTKGENPYLSNVLSASSAPTRTSSGRTRRSRSASPSVHKAYPSDTITPPVNPTSTQAAQHRHDVPVGDRGLPVPGPVHQDRRAAGKNLTVASFTKAGYGLKNASTSPASASSTSPRATSSPCANSRNASAAMAGCRLSAHPGSSPTRWKSG